MFDSKRARASENVILKAIWSILLIICNRFESRSFGVTWVDLCGSDLIPAEVHDPSLVQSACFSGTTFFIIYVAQTVTQAVVRSEGITCPTDGGKANHGVPANCPREWWCQTAPLEGPVQSLLVSFEPNDAEAQERMQCWVVSGRVTCHRLEQQREKPR